jgi:hypothetical protein
MCVRVRVQYDIYDNCPRTREYLAQQGNKSMRWLLNSLRSKVFE